jgi:hypothetical protein
MRSNAPCRRHPTRVSGQTARVHAAAAGSMHARVDVVVGRLSMRFATLAPDRVRGSKCERVHRASITIARASGGGGGREDWEDLFAEFERQASEADAEASIPRAKVRALERALARGRRQVQVRDLCRELEMERDEILGWLKRNGHRAPELAKRYAEELANEDAAREEREREREEREQARKKREAEASFKPKTGPGGMPAYKSYKKTRLGAANIDTLEKVYAMTQYPDDSMVESIQRATRLPPSKIIAWFKEKRQGQKRARGRQEPTERRSEQRGTTGGYSYTRRSDTDGPGMRSGNSRDSYGGRSQSRDQRDSSTDWNSY